MGFAKDQTQKQPLLHAKNQLAPKPSVLECSDLLSEIRALVKTNALASQLLMRDYGVPEDVLMGHELMQNLIEHKFNHLDLHR